MNLENNKKVISLIVLAAVFGGVVGSIFTTMFIQPASVRVNEIKTTEEKLRVVEDSAITSVVDEAKKSVVSIVISKEVPVYDSTGDFYSFGSFEDFFYPRLRRPSTEEKVKQKVGGGSGFVITADGLIVTNRHVVADEDAQYSVVLNDGSEYDAQVVDRDLVNDIAFVKIDVKDLKPLELGDSDQLKIGQTVLAIGNTLAEYSNTVTKGIISGIGRKVTAGDGFSESTMLDSAIQTDAAINPGNSGGPLINLAGQVIGINTAVNRAGESIGFAIPINEAKQVVESVIKEGRIVRPFLGVRYVMINENIAKREGFEIDHGAYVFGDNESGAVVKGSPADKAGIKEGDIIFKVGDKEVTVDDPLAELLSKYKPGDTVELKVKREKEEISMKVTLADKKDF